MKGEQSYLFLSRLEEMLLLCVKQSIQLSFAVFTVKITNDTRTRRPVDTTVYFLYSPISFCVVSDSTGLSEGERDVETDPK